MKRVLISAVALPLLSTATASHADQANVQTPAPVIYLADNLDESADLGWCIDTVGRGFAETLHAHSCKPQGGDVQFGYRADTQQIFSVEFDGKCMALVDSENDQVPFGLIDCDPTSSEQRFGFKEGNGQFFRVDAPNECVVAGANSRSAGPFMSRDLTLGDCETTDRTLSTWVIQNG